MRNWSGIAGMLLLLAGCDSGAQQDDVPTYDATVAPVTMPPAVYGASPSPAPSASAAAKP